MEVLTALLLLMMAGGQSAAISGRVSEQGSGRPLPRMVVTLATADRSKQVEAVTDADGRYEFPGLEPGRYAIAAAHDEHRSTYLRQWFGEAAPAAPFGVAPRLNIELHAGEVRSGVDVAVSRALAIEGRVSDPWDEPMADVEVSVTRADGRFVFARPAFSDDLGTYRLYGLAPGRYRVCAKVQDPSDDSSAADASRLVRTCHPASMAEADAGDVTLMSTDASGIDIRVQRIGSHSISGFVVDAAGAPVDDARVAALPFEESAAPASSTSRGGAFALKGLMPGRYMVRASIGGARPGDPIPPAREMELGYASADVGVVDAAELAITLSKPTKVAGTIAFEGGPAPRGDALRMVVFVQSRPAEEPALRFDGRPPPAPVNDGLTFELGGLYRLPFVIGLQGLPEGWTLKSVRFEDRDITYAPTDFGGRSSPGRLELVVTNRVAHPSARVTDEQGAPVTAYHIVAIPADPARWKLWPAMMPAAPSADGVLKLGTMLPGDYLVAALSTEDWVVLIRDPARVDGVASIATKVTLARDDRRTIELRLAKLPEKQ